MRLIDADDMSKRYTHYGISHPYDAVDLDDMLAEMPTVDAVSVVRCKDCRYWRQEVDSTTHWVCVQHSIGELLMYTTPDHFCACGLKCKEAKA